MIDLATPTIEIGLSDTEAVAAASSQRIADVMAEVERAESVVTASRAFMYTEARVAQLKAAQVGLNAKGKELVEAVITGHRQVEESLLTRYSGETSVDTGAVIEELLRKQTESAAVSRVLERLAMHLLPVSHIETTRAEAGLFFARGEELMRLANARFEVTCSKLMAAAEHEGGLTVDIRSTFSGALLGCAGELRRQAQGKLRNADEAKRKYEETAAANLAAA